MSQPIISVVTPTLNAARFVDQVMRSVLTQDYPNVEYFVQDGGSTDGTAEIVECYADRLTGWVCEPDDGQANAINRALGRASGEVLAWINADDLYEPQALSRAVDVLAGHPEASAVVGGAWMGFPDGTRTLREPRDLSRAGILNWRTNWFVQPAVFIRRSAWERAGPLDETLGWAFDLDLWLKLAVAGPLVATRQVLATFREHPASKTSAGAERMRAETGSVILRHASDAELRDLFVVQQNELERLDAVCAALIAERVRRIGGGIEGEVVLYGAGAHTPWLLGVLKGVSRFRVTAILDDGAQPGRHIDGIPVIRPEALSRPPGVILVSSDTVGDRLVARARQLFDRQVRIVELYEGLPAGPYPKAAEHRAGWSAVDDVSRSAPAGLERASVRRGDRPA